MSTALARIGEDTLGSGDGTVEQLRSVRVRIGTADFESLFAIRAWAEVVGAAARAKRAADVAREAAETRIRAERQLGALLLAAPGLENSLDLGGARPQEWKAVADIPAATFEEAVLDLLDRGKSCAAQWVIKNARVLTLRKVEAGVWEAWDGTHFTQEGRRWTPHYGLGARSALESARDALRRNAGLRKGWHENPVSAKLDDAHARARRLAQALSLLGSTLTGTARAQVAEAELLQAKVAGLLYAAYRDAPAELLDIRERENAA